MKEDDDSLSTSEALRIIKLENDRIDERTRYLDAKLDFIQEIEQSVKDNLIKNYKHICKSFMVSMSFSLTSALICISIIASIGYGGFAFWVNFVCLLINMYMASKTLKNYCESKKEFKSMKIKKAVV